MSEVAAEQSEGRADGPDAQKIVLEVRDLETHFHTPSGTVRAVDGLSYTVREGEILGVVGESGCGKSVTALSILRLIPEPPGQIVGGAIEFEGNDLLALSEPEMEMIRGNDISMIFQEPMTALNPLYTVGRQISESIALQGLDQFDACGNTRIEQAGNNCAVKLNDRKQKPARCCALKESSCRELSRACGVTRREVREPVPPPGGR